jgi:thioesterase domain-containing protein/acyl carrier protein
LPAPAREAYAAPQEFVAPRNETEEVLVRLWGETLRLEKIGIRDDFFALGGQSLLAVSLFARIEREFGCKLPLAVLFRERTVEGLASALGGGGVGAAAWSSLVPIQTAGGGTPLFLVHGAGGNVLLYRCLADRLAPEIPLYGLQSQGLDGISAPLDSIEAMAAHYLRDIRSVQPHGPYHLGGYCMGGTIAYEMAQQLTAQGEAVALVAMLDTYNYNLALKTSRAAVLAQRIRFHAGNLLRLKPAETRKYLAEKVRLARDGEFRALLHAPATPPQGGKGAARAESGVEASVQAVNDAAADRYVPKPYAGCLTLFKPQINYKFYPDPKMGWGELALGGLDIVELPINPHAMLVEPYVRELAETLKLRLGGEPARAASGEREVVASAIR